MYKFVIGIDISKLTASADRLDAALIVERKVAEGKSKMSVLNAVKANRTADAAHPSGHVGHQKKTEI